MHQTLVGRVSGLSEFTLAEAQDMIIVACISLPMNVVNVVITMCVCVRHLSYGGGVECRTLWPHRTRELDHF